MCSNTSNTKVMEVINEFQLVIIVIVSIQHLRISKKIPPRRGIEPRSPAWQAGILTTILSRIRWGMNSLKKFTTFKKPLMCEWNLISLEPDKKLFTPGPLLTSRTVKEAMMRDLGSRDSEFIDTIKIFRDGLLKVAGLKS